MKPGAVAIVGIGCRFSGAHDLQQFWRMTLAGEDGFSPVPADRWDQAAFFDENARTRDKSYAPRGGFLDDVRSFPAVALQVPPRRVEVMDPQQRLSLECAFQAVDDAGMTPGALPRKTGVYMGVTATQYKTLSGARVIAQLMASGALGEAPEDPSVIARAVERVLPARPFTAPGLLSNMIAATVAQELRVHGPAYTTDAACASGLVAVSNAVDALRAGSIDCALAGGVFISLTPEHHIAFSRIGAISKQGACLPFDARADGFVEGDGAGVLVLKRHADAVRDGDRVYAVIHGVGINNDGGGTGPMAPVKSGQVEVVQTAWQDAKKHGADPKHLGYIEAHGTGTTVGDKIEFDGLSEAIGAEVVRAGLGSSKANFGHTMSAAGICGLIRATLALHHKTIPPMAHFESAKDELRAELEKDSAPFFIPTAPEAWDGDVRHATVSSFGFGGTNVHVVVGSDDPATTESTNRGAARDQPELVRISSHSVEALRDLAKRTAEAIAADANATVAGVARSWTHRRHQAARLAVVADSRTQLIARLAAFGAGDYPDGVALNTVDEDAEAPKVAFMFPGQGAQRLGMIAGIRDRFPIVAATLATLDTASAEVIGRPVGEFLYPERRTTAVDTDTADAELTDTQHCQPALFAVGTALDRLLRQVGVEPVVCVGHSVGEFTAAAAAGVLSIEDGVRWTARRGAAMSAMTGDTGAMAAIVAPREEVEALLVPGVVLANLNHPRQAVVSGSTEAVAKVVEAALAKELKAVPLTVSHGFHSPVFADLDLSAVIDAIPLSDPATPVASCIQDHTYASADEARQVFKDHATSPVIWTDAIAQCRAAGATLFLQVGAGGPLVSFAKGILRGVEGVQALSLASKDDEDRGASLLLTLGQLWTLGVDLDLDSVTAKAPIASVPPIVLPREDYWVVKDAPTTTMQLVAGSNTPRTAARVVSIVADASPASGGVADIVIGAVARASAYPREALKPAMKLGDDLGFDSMMVADLAEDLGKAIEGFQGIPQEILINSPTIQDIIDYAENPTAMGDGTSAADDDAPLSRWGLRWIETPLPSDAVGAWATRTVTPGTFLAIGDAVHELAETLVAQGWTHAADGAADLVVYGAPRDAAVPLNAVLSGERTAPDYAADFIAVLDAQAGAGKQPDVLVLRLDDDLWAEALSGAARCVAREWPDAMVKTIRGDVDAATLLAEFASADRTTDVRYAMGEAGLVRQVLGTLPFDDIHGDDGASYAIGADDVVLVTGGTRGIGRALGLQLAKTGAKVLLMGRSTPVDAPTADGVVYVNADVIDAEAVSQALADQGDVTVLIHAAGVLADGPLGSVSAEVGQLARDVKVLGFINAVRACGTSLKVAHGIGSWAGRFGNASQTHYGAANALLSELSWRLPARIRGVVSEFGPWRDSEMVQSIPASVRQAMRSQGIDFVSDEAGLNALVEDLQSGTKSVVRGRNVPATTRRAVRVETLSADTHPFLLDHAIDGVPVLPLAGAATLIAETAGVTAPFSVEDLTLYKGVAVRDTLTVTIVVSGERAEIRQGDGHTLSYRAKVRSLDWNAPEAQVTPTQHEGGAAPSLTLAEFYRDVTFHGPLLQGITSIDGVGDDYIRGTLHTTDPAAWVPGTTQASWGIDPLALDSAMQLTAYVAWTRYQRAGTPVGFDRITQLKPWPTHSDVTAEAVFPAREDDDDDRFEATLTFWNSDGDVIAIAERVVAQMPRVEATDAADAEIAEVVEEEAPFEIKPEWVDPAQWRGYKDIAFRLVAVESMGVKNPYFDLHQGTARNTTLIDDREIINYSSYNYLGLSGDPRIIENVHQAMKRYGTSVSASRIASGERPFHRELEAELAKAQGVDDAVVMAGGHATNINTIGHVFNPGDLILHDELIHDSCLQGIKLSGAARRSFRHEDMGDIESQLKELRRHYEKVLLLVEGVYSMDGDITNLPELIRLKKKYGCMLMVDEAHSFGCVGPTGFGVGEHYKALGYDIDPRDVDIWMGTMSKSLSAMGGWIAGKKEFITFLRYTTPGFVFAAGIPATLGVAALSALRLWQGEDVWRVKKLQENSKRFYELLKERGQDTGPSKGESPVIPVITGDSMHAMQLSEKLLDVHGINAKPIIFPAVANDAARLRFFMTALHTDEQLVFTADKIAETLREIRGKA